MSDSGNINSTGVNAYWEIEQREEITCVADVTSSLNNDYVVLYNPAGTKFHAWFNVATAGVDPAPANSTAIEVTIAENATATAVATALAAALEAHASFHASSDGAVVTLTNDAVGEVTASAANGAGSPGFSYEVIQTGGYMDLGLLEGDVSMSGFSPEVQEILAHQTGATPVSSIMKGSKPELSLVMLETDADKRQQLFKSIGGEYTTTNSDLLYGVGTSKVGTVATQYSRRLRLHPVALDAAVRTEDVIYWKTLLVPDSLTYSTENPDKFEVSFLVYPDLEMPEEICIVSFGDWSDLAPVQV